jgi:hypothetical protein
MLANAAGSSNGQELITVRLEEIHGEHELVKKVRRESTGHMRELPQNILTAAGLSDLAHRYPMHVVEKKQGYVCIGGLRLFRLMTLNSPKAAVVPVLVHRQGIKEQQLKDYIYIDLYLAPALFGVYHKDRRQLCKEWGKPQRAGLFSCFIYHPGIEALEKLLGFDFRAPKAKL